jgi:3-deoxy-manno-octulosonate cytidylyltransferase (CMP-KDO synthetase)
VVAEITSHEERDNPNVVKAVLSMSPEASMGRALYFTRAAVPTGEGPLYHHIGIYGYQRAALEKFVSLPPSPLEKRERLEQLRVLEAGMSISAAVVDTVPVGVDAPDDLALADRLLKAQT